jgi:hypothetical protein
VPSPKSANQDHMPVRSSVFMDVRSGVDIAAQKLGFDSRGTFTALAPRFSHWQM